VRLVGIEPKKRNLAVNEVLGEDSCDDGFADAALFATDEMKPSHTYGAPDKQRVTDDSERQTPLAKQRLTGTASAS
jgi:hypothetical protein